MRGPRCLEAGHLVHARRDHDPPAAVRRVAVQDNAAFFGVGHIPCSDLGLRVDAPQRGRLERAAVGVRCKRVRLGGVQRGWQKLLDQLFRFRFAAACMFEGARIELDVGKLPAQHKVQRFGG